MLNKQIETQNKTFIQLNPVFTSIQQLSDTSKESETIETDDDPNPAIQNFYQELIEPYNDTLKSSCEAAIGSYLKCLSQTRVQENEAVDRVEKIQNIKKVQKHVIETLQSHLSHNKRISVIQECRKPCECCYVIPPYLLQKVQQIDQIRETNLVEPATNSGNNEQKFGWGNRKVKHLTKHMHDQPTELLHSKSEESSAITAPKIKKTASTQATNPTGQETPITIYDAQHKENLPGQFISSNQSDHQTQELDRASKQMLEAATDVHAFWMKNFNLNSFNGQGSEIRSTVHFGELYANAFWNGYQMVFGDGDENFGDFTTLSIVGHEFGHAITGDKLDYEGESGALNEHFSDVWGALIEQYKKRQTAHQADWLIGKGVIKVGKKSFPLRSMKNPGSAYHSPILGKDPQPDHYDTRYKGEKDNKGVHINSGIPNKAFCLFAKAQGGFAWEKAGRLWYMTLQSEGLIHPDCTMREFAQATICNALQFFPSDYKMHQDLANAWQAVGLG